MGGFGTGRDESISFMHVTQPIPTPTNTTHPHHRQTNRYHHITVLLFCWHSYATESSTGLYFVAMNYSVHAIMYVLFVVVWTMDRWMDRPASIS